MKLVTALFFTLALIGCKKEKTTTLDVVPPGDSLISCIHKYEPDLNLYYLNSHMVIVIPNNVDIKQYRILDLDGVRHQITEQEWDNYVCVLKPSTAEPVAKGRSLYSPQQKFDLKGPKTSKKLLLA